MFKSIADEHKATLAQKKSSLKELEAKIMEQSLPAVSNAVFAEMNSGCERILVNQKEIDKKCRIVRDEWQRFNKELDRWSAMIGDLDRAVKDIGDVRAWSQGVQEDIQSIVEQLEASPGPKE
jgi:FKBP-type peptidyl-prolyl cis-trans isomerase (trigger factor)